MCIVCTSSDVVCVFVYVCYYASFCAAHKSSGPNVRLEERDSPQIFVVDNSCYRPKLSKTKCIHTNTQYVIATAITYHSDLLSVNHTKY